jgi:hypothetical protein
MKASTIAKLIGSLGVALGLICVAPQAWFHNLIYGAYEWYELSWHQNASYAASLVGTFFGIIVAFLIYFQLRGQNKARKHVAAITLAAQWSDLVKSLNDSPGFCGVYLRGVASFKNLDNASKLQFGVFYGRFFMNFECMYLCRGDGTLHRSLWKEVERTMEDLVVYPGVQDWWSTRRRWYTEEFRKKVEELIGDSKDVMPKAYLRYGVRLTSPLEWEI